MMVNFLYLYELVVMLHSACVFGSKLKRPAYFTIQFIFATIYGHIALLVLFIGSTVLF